MVTVTIHVRFRSEIVTFIDLKTRLEASVEQLGILGILVKQRSRRRELRSPVFDMLLLNCSSGISAIKTPVRLRVKLLKIMALSFENTS